MSAETCPVDVWSREIFGGHYICGKAVKRNGKCGIHARVDEQEAAKKKSREEKIAHAATLTERLARHGINARISYDGSVYLPSAGELAAVLDQRYGSDA